MAQEEIWFAAQTNPIELFPKFEEVSCGAGIEIPIEMKYEKQLKQILSKFDGHSEAPSSFEEVS